MSLINYNELEEPIKEIEKILDVFDMEEKQLILKFVNQRFSSKLQQAKINDNLQNMPLQGLVKRFMKQENKDGEE